MVTSFDRCFAHVVGVEGGFSNHPRDRGGPTKYGITKGTLEEFLGHTVSVQEVADLRLDLAKNIYRQRYWNQAKLDEVASQKIQLVLFDQAVNRGVSSAVKQAQRVLNLLVQPVVDVTGRCDTQTVARLNQVPPEAFCASYLATSLSFYRELVDRNPTQQVFLKGWENRVKKLAAAVGTEGAL